MDSINNTDMAMLDKEVSNEAESELGPLKYLAETTGYPMNEVVNWFLLLIIFVFDPLAIALVISANMAFSQLKNKKDDEVNDYFTNRNRHLEKIVEMKTSEEFDNIPEEIKDKEDQLMLEEEEDEKRMNIIGQNGNDGLHYSKINPTTDELHKLEDHLKNLKNNNKDKLYYEEDYSGDLDRLTDTTQTLIVNKSEETPNEKRTLKYRKRK